VPGLSTELTPFQTADELLDNQISFVPVTKDKRPALKQGSVKQYWSRVPTPEEVNRWFALTYPPRNIGICLGQISRGGLWALDADDERAVKFIEDKITEGVIPATPRITKTRRGKHFFFVSPPGIKTRLLQKKCLLGHFDIRGEGGQVVAPPSEINWESFDPETGEITTHTYKYTWEQNGPWSEVPEYDFGKFLNLLGKNDKPENIDIHATPRDPNFDFFTAVSEGERNSRLVQVAGKLIGRDPTPETVLSILELVNSRYDPPMSQPEIERIVKSIFTTHYRNHPLDKTIPGLIEEDFENRLCARDVLETEPEPNDWLIKDSFLKKQLGIIYGAPGCGKGLFTAKLVTNLSAGVPVFGKWESPHPVRVLLLSGEDPTNILHQRYREAVEHIPAENRRQMEYELYFKNGDLALTRQEGRTIKVHEENVDGLNRLLDRVHPELLVLDTLTRFLGGGDENDNPTMTKSCVILEQIIKEHDCNIILVHHTNKGAGDIIHDQQRLKTSLSQASLRGASALAGAIRWALMLVPISTSLVKKITGNTEYNSPDGTFVVAKVVKKNLGAPEQEILLTKKGGVMKLAWEPDQASDEFINADVEILVGEVENRNQDQGDLLAMADLPQALGWSVARVKNAKTRAIKNGRLQEKTIGKKKYLVRGEQSDGQERN
jgi:RecA-family ATPase